jgi:hypothetical protein
MLCLRRGIGLAALVAITLGTTIGALAPGSAASAAGCSPKTGPYQKQVEALLGLRADGVASAADCIAVQKFQTRFGIQPNAGYAGPLTFSVATRLHNSNYKGCAAPKKGRKVCVDLSNQVMWVLDGSKRVYGPTPIRTGRKSLTTPTGNFHIGDKKVDTISTIFHVHLPYWERFYRDMGFHQTTTYLYDAASPGSHGCINLLVPDAKGLYALTTAGSTPVQIFGRKPGT